MEKKSVATTFKTIARGLGAGRVKAWIDARLFDMSKYPTVIHITHTKAGSQWVKQVLRGAAPDRFVKSQVDVAHFKEGPVEQGGIYAAVYIHRKAYEQVAVPENHIKFVVIRDLRDTTVSHYFSSKVSHRLVSDRVATSRQKLSDLSLEEGLRYTMQNLVRASARIQASWIDSGVWVVRYEDLLTDELGMFRQIVDYCQIEVSDERLRQVVTERSFETKSGRKRGEEDITSHYRKGIAGDWQNYFTDDLKVEFKELYGDLLIKTGYESDLNW